MEQKTKQSTCVTSSNLKRDLNSRGSPPSGHLGSDSLATSKAVIHYRARSNPFSLPHAKQKTARWAVFVLFGCGGSGARRNDRTVVNKVPFGTLEPYGDRARRREGFEPHVLAFSLRRKCCGQFGGSDLPPAGHSLPPHPPSYSPFGLITLSLCVHTLSHENKSTALSDGALLFLYRTTEKDIAFEPGRHYRIPAFFRFTTQHSPALSTASIVLLLCFFTNS